MAKKRGHGALLPDRFHGRTDPAARLVRWTVELALHSGGSTSDRVVRSTAKRVEGWVVHELLGGPADFDALAGVARVLGRTALPGDWVAVIASQSVGEVAGFRMISLNAQAPGRKPFAIVWRSPILSGGRLGPAEVAEVDPSVATALGDFFDPHAVIDPGLERKLIAHAFPGARRAVPPPQRETPLISLLDEPPLEAEHAEACAKVAAESKLEAARALPDQIVQRPLRPLFFLPAVLLPVAEATARGRVHIERVKHAPSELALYDAILRHCLADPQPGVHPAIREAGPLPSLFALAVSTARVHDRVGPLGAWPMAEDLVSSAVFLFGKRTPAEIVQQIVGRPGEEAGEAKTAALAGVVAAFAWRAALCARPNVDPEEHTAALIALGRMTIALLDRAGAPPGKNPARIRALAERQLGRLAPPYTIDDDAWKAAIEAVWARSPAADLVPATLGRQAALLHTLLIRLAFHGALPGAEIASLDPAGCLDPTADELARVLVRAVARRGASDPGTAIRVLRRALELRPGNLAALGCANELRFLSGERGDLADWFREAKERPDALAPAAEALVLAREGNQQAAVRRAAAWVHARAKGTEHAWVGEVRAVLARPGLASSARAQALLAGAIERPTGAELDRAGRALWRGDPRAELEALSVLLREAEDEAPEPVPLGPTVEARDGSSLDATAWVREPDGIELALAALRKVQRSVAPELRDAIEEHRKRARFLSDPAGASPWLVAAAELHEVARDPARAGDVGAALERAKAALDACVAAEWRERARAQARAAGLAGDVLDAIAGASSEDARSRVDGRIQRALEERRHSSVATTADEREQDEGEARDVQMIVPNLAIERSRRELGTPEWAIAEGLRQVALFELAGGRRDQKALKGTRDDRGALWELRQHRRHLPVRVFFRRTSGDPEVVAIAAKEDDEQHLRVIERVRGW